MPLRRVLSALLGAAIAAAPAPVRGQDPAADWAVLPGFRLDVAASGLRYPTAIAFVPRPGYQPSDPLYFVAELGGRIKVVTRNGEVHTFAEGFARFTVATSGPVGDGENGTAGLCLDPERGFVFVTFVYRDTLNVLRNGMARFDTRPGTFAVKPVAQLALLSDVLARDTSAVSHQIGPCQVQDGAVFVAVGDGTRHQRSRDPQSSLGKVLRITAEGAPFPGNPYLGSGLPGAAPYVWVTGVRNVFSLRAVAGRLFAAENGPSFDRFLELRRGEDYGWDGSEWSIGRNAPFVFVPAVSPVQMDYYPEGSPVFPPEFRRLFYLATAGETTELGAGVTGGKSVIMLSYDLAARQTRGKPAHLLRYVGQGHGSLAALAFGPDGLYFAPLFPGADGSSRVFRISYEAGRPHRLTIDIRQDARTIILEKGCLGCHQIGERGGTVGPALDPGELGARLGARLKDEDYLDSLRALDRRAEEPFPNTRSARRAVAAAEGHDRVKEWLVQRLLDPRFDMPAASMPDPGLTEREARVVAEFLAGRPVEPPGLVGRLREKIPPARYRYVVVSFLLGFALAALLTRSRRKA